jgi:hypothetical protein
MKRVWEFDCSKESRNFKCQANTHYYCAQVQKVVTSFPSLYLLRTKNHILYVSGNYASLCRLESLRKTLQECNFHENEIYAIKMAINGSEINLRPLLLGELQLRSFNFPLERPFCNNEGGYGGVYILWYCSLIMCDQNLWGALLIFSAHNALGLDPRRRATMHTSNMCRP